MILPILTDNHPTLRQTSKSVAKVTRSLDELTKNMLETMYDANGCGLAAPQVGILKRIIVIDTGDGPVVLYNPEIVTVTGSETDTEGCLSLPGIAGKVERSATVVVKGLAPGGRLVELRGDGLLARALQHEIDHLDGILFIDKATEVGPIKD